MYTYVRATKLPDIVGRSAYITNATGRHKAEDIVCCGGAVEDWKPYQTYERNHQRSSEPNNEGRELIIALPNSWGGLIGKPLLKSRMDSLIQQLIGKNTDYQYAVHWNKAHTNLHAHIIFSERQKCPQTNAKGSISDFYDRDIYLTQDGKIARRKADRAVDEQGNVKPPVHRKGEPKELAFTAKDTRYKSKEWLQGVKQAVKHRFALEIEKKHITNYLHTYHEGKAPRAAEIAKQRNEVIRSLNQWLDERKKEGYVLKKEGDKAYSELYKRAVGIIEDGKDIDEWFYENIALNAEKVQQQLRKKEERAARAAVRKAAAQEQAAEKVLDTAYKLAIDCYNSRVSRDIERNNYTSEALGELTGSEYGAYISKEHPKLEKNLKKAIQEVAKVGKTRELTAKLELYFQKKLTIDYSAHGRSSSCIAYFEEPFRAADNLMREITSGNSCYYDLPPSPSQHKAAEEKRKREERAALERAREKAAKERAEKEKSRPRTYEEPAPKRSQKKKHDDWSR
jgi:hypothetical protein